MPMLRLYDMPKNHHCRDTVVTIGNFDGVHRGHRHLIWQIVRRARDLNADAVVLTFEPHPLTVLHPDVHVRRLNSPEERAEIIASLGVDLLITYPFTPEVASVSARDFVSMLRDRLCMVELWVGPDFALGRNREGDIEKLQELGHELGFEVRRFEPFSWHGHVIHSTDIRLLVSGGAVDKAEDLLGYPYSLAGEVVPGDGRGKKIGVPTANLAVCSSRLLPASGVYVAWATVGGGSRYPAVVNVGNRPTFDGESVTVEAHLLDFYGNIYGWEVVLEFRNRLRCERRFSSVEALVAQIRRDIEAARNVLGVPPKEPSAPNPFFHEIEHTADWEIQVVGRNYESLFANAARAMYMLVMAPFDRPAETRREIGVSGLDRESLLVKWLGELLYLQEAHEELYTRFCIHQITDTHLEAEVWGVRGRSDMAHIKAVTYHDLSIEPRPDGYEATILFDT